MDPEVDVGRGGTMTTQRHPGGGRAAAGRPASKVRAAIIEPVGGHGGMHYYDLELCRGLASAGVEPTLDTCDATEIPQGLPFTVSRRFRRVFGDDPAPIRGLRFAAGLASSVWAAYRRGAAVVHFHFFAAGPLQLLGVLLARAAGRRVVVTSHDVESFDAGKAPAWVAQATYRLAHRVIAHNRASCGELTTTLGIPADRVDVVPHGNYLSFVPPPGDREAARREIGVPRDAKVLLFFGQIKQVKGLDLLLRAMPGILGEVPSAFLVVAGRPWREDAGYYLGLARELGVEDRCNLHFRYIPDGEVAGFFTAADLLVCPYRKIYQSGVALLGMSFGTALVASDLPPMRELIRDGENGFLFASGDANDLAAVVVRALQDPLRVASAARCAHATIVARHSWERVGELTMQCYLRALQ